MFSGIAVSEYVDCVFDCSFIDFILCSGATSHKRTGLYTQVFWESIWLACFIDEYVFWMYLDEYTIEPELNTSAFWEDTEIMFASFPEISNPSFLIAPF